MKRLSDIESGAHWMRLKSRKTDNPKHFFNWHCKCNKSKRIRRYPHENQKNYPITLDEHFNEQYMSFFSFSFFTNYFSFRFWRTQKLFKLENDQKISLFPTLVTLEFEMNSRLHKHTHICPKIFILVMYAYYVIT